MSMMGVTNRSVNIGLKLDPTRTSTFLQIVYEAFTVKITKTGYRKSL
jgi:hypothetical protein